MITKINISKVHGYLPGTSFTGISLGLTEVSWATEAGGTSGLPGRTALSAADAFALGGKLFMSMVDLELSLNLDDVTDDVTSSFFSTTIWLTSFDDENTGAAPPLVNGNGTSLQQRTREVTHQHQRQILYLCSLELTRPN